MKGREMDIAKIQEKMKLQKREEWVTLKETNSENRWLCKLNDLLSLITNMASNNKMNLMDRNIQGAISVQ
jgi:hypothetical protein